MHMLAPLFKAVTLSRGPLAIGIIGLPLLPQRGYDDLLNFLARYLGEDGTMSLKIKLGEKDYLAGFLFLVGLPYFPAVIALY